MDIGPTFSSVIDEEGRLYTWGQSNSMGQMARDLNESNRMPQIVDSFGGKIVTAVAIGQDFGIALG